MYLLLKVVIRIALDESIDVNSIDKPPIIIKFTSVNSSNINE